MSGMDTAAADAGPSLAGGQREKLVLAGNVKDAVGGNSGAVLEIGELGIGHEELFLPADREHKYRTFGTLNVDLAIGDER